MRAPKELGGQDLYSTWTYKKIVLMELIEFIQNLADKDRHRADLVKMGLPPDFPQDMRTVVAFQAVGDKMEMTVTEYDWTAGQMFDYFRGRLQS